MNTIQQELDSIKTNFGRTIDLINGLPFSQREEVRMIEFYSNSRYLRNQRDELGRDKPFMQILNAICDVENTAKDIDTKDIQITSDDANHYLESWLLSKDIYVWMKEVNFAKTLNDMRDMHTRYGSLLVKKVMKDGELTLELPQWKNIINDQVDILGGAIIETHWMTAMGIAKKKDVWNKKAIKKVMEKFKNKGSNTRVPVYEVRGEFPKSYMIDVENKYRDKVIIPTDNQKMDFSYQLYYIAGNPSELEQGDAFIEALTPLYWEDDTERVYKYLARKPKAGRGFGVGVFKEGEEAQVGTNDAILKQSRAMEYTTKVISYSASKKLKGRNLLTETDDGIILETEDNKPIVPLNLLPSGGLQQYQNVMQQWYQQLEKTTSAYAAQRGESPDSGTPFRLQATVLQQSSSVFKTLQQEMGIFYTEIIEDWILPHLAKRLNKQHILSYDFSPEELKAIDKNFAIKHANEKFVEKVRSTGIVDKLPTQEDYDALVESADTFIKGTKSQRFIDIPKDFYKNLKAKVTVNITGEQRNKAATLESLNSILTVYASNPTLSQDPVASQLLARIIELSGAGISPVAITAAISEKNKADQAAQQAMAQQDAQAQVQPQAPMSLQANPQGQMTQ